MKEKAISVFAVCFGILLVGLSSWQWSVGTIYFKGGSLPLNVGWPCLVVEIGIGVALAIKGVRGYRSGCWPPPPLE